MRNASSTSHAVSLSLREAELHQLWRELDDHSVLLIGPRRIGKTTLIREAIQAPSKDHQRFRGVRADLEYSRSAEDAVERIVAELAKAGLAEPVSEQIKRNISSVNVGGAGAEIRDGASVDPWRRLGLVLDEAAKKMKQEELLLIGLDEVPWWLDGIRRNVGAEAAREALAALRYLRQRDDLQGRLRMVLTGSIGLAGLARSVGASAELDDLKLVELGPLSLEAGSALFESEVARQGTTCTAEAIHSAFEMGGGSPFWIKELAARSVASARGLVGVDQDEVNDAVTAMLDPKMRNLFADEGYEHLRRRHPEEHGLLSKILTLVAQRPEGAPREGLIATALAEGAVTRRRAEEFLYILVDEFYLRYERKTDAFRFVLPLFQRWWLWYGEEP